MLPFIFTESAERLVQRLSTIHLTPQTILNVSCPAAFTTQLLSTRFPTAKIVEQDHLFDFPDTSEQFDLVVSNLLLFQYSDYRAIFLQFKRLLKPNGLLLFTTLGVDSFKELEATIPFIDMHLMGDELLRQQWLDPVMDIEWVTCRYKSEAARHKTASVFFDDVVSDEAPALSLEYYPLTFELIFAQAWNQALKGAFLNEQGEVLIPVTSIASLKKA